MTDLRAKNAAMMAGTPEAGFNVVIVCCSGTIEASYWQQRLEASKGVVLPSNTLVYSVDEDWEGGAGNGLGTLYAYTKAMNMAKASGKDVDDMLRKGEISVALYHTAGKGTRLAPLPASENNNKPGVKLPATVTLRDGSVAPITILEAVIKQTAVYAESRKGRLSVFWGDQIFIPSVPTTYNANAHIDLLCQMLTTLPDAEVWAAKGLHSYGLVVHFASGQGAQIDKVDHSTAVRMLSSLGDIKTVGPSLGSFSVTSNMLTALLLEFSKELGEKKGQLDTDPHFWMPMTLPQSGYIELMGKKGMTAEEAAGHWNRMQDMLKRFDKGGMVLFGGVNCGEDAYWWDYGQIGFYQYNNLRLAQDGEENDAYRTFFSAPRGEPKGSLVKDCTIDSTSSVSACELHGGSVKGSALCNVVAGHIEAEGCIIVNVTAKRIKAAPGSIIYNTVDDSDELVVGPDQCLTTVFAEDGKQTRLGVNVKESSGATWKLKLPENPCTFEEMHKHNKGVDPVKTEAAQIRAHDELAKKLGAERRRQVS